jgi:hypothetical protein
VSALVGSSFSQHAGDKLGHAVVIAVLKVVRAKSPRRLGAAFVTPWPVMQHAHADSIVVMRDVDAMHATPGRPARASLALVLFPTAFHRLAVSRVGVVSPSNHWHVSTLLSEKVHFQTLGRGPLISFLPA